MVYAHTPDDLREMEVGLKVYSDKVEEFIPLIFGTVRGIKTSLVSEEDWAAVSPAENPAVAYSTSSAAPVPQAVTLMSLPSDQNDLLRV